MELFAGRRGDECIIFRDQGSTDPLGASMVLYDSFPLICCATWPGSEKVEFRPIEMGCRGRSVAKYFRSCCCIRDSL